METKDSKRSIFVMFGFILISSLLVLMIMQSKDKNVTLATKNDGTDKTYTSAPALTIDSNKQFQAVFSTSEGDFTVELFAKGAPNTVNNFVFLSRDKYYDGVKFHRIVKDFIIQSGSRLSLDDNPQNDGLGGPGYRFSDEMNWEAMKLPAEQITTLSQQGFVSVPKIPSQRLERYTLAMANAGPNTNGSQFFFVTAPDADTNQSILALQGKHTPFGKVISGQEVADKINNASVIGANTSAPIPSPAIVIKSITIIEK